MVNDGNNNKNHYLFVLLIIGIIIILFDVLGYLNTFKGRLNQVMIPVEHFFSETSRSVSSTIDSFTSISGLRVENDVLKKRIAELEADDVIIDDVMKENEVLRRQLSYKNNVSIEYVVARVVSTNHLSDKSFFKIDKGGKDGFEKGDIVVYENNYVGVLHEVFDYTSTVMLLDSTQSAILCKTEVEGVEGIVKGSKDGLLFTEISVMEKISLREKVLYYTEKVSFPLVVGYIDEIFDNPSSPKQTARLESYVPLMNLSYVFVIK